MNADNGTHDPESEVIEAETPSVYIEHLYPHITEVGKERVATN